MKEYIEREAAINEVLVGDIDKDFPRMDIAARLHDIPAADVRPALRGKWVDHPRWKWIYAECSECEVVSDVKSNYCPNCGADMREES